MSDVDFLHTALKAWALREYPYWETPGLPREIADGFRKAIIQALNAGYSIGLSYSGTEQTPRMRTVVEQVTDPLTAGHADHCAFWKGYPEDNWQPYINDCDCGYRRLLQSQPASQEGNRGDLRG